jgi:hypothetical protein
MAVWLSRLELPILQKDSVKEVISGKRNKDGRVHGFGFCS